MSHSLNLIKSQFNLRDDPEAMQGVMEGEAEELLAGGKSEELLDTIWAKYSEYKKGKSMVVVEGISGQGISHEIELNGKLAAELGAPVLMILDLLNENVNEASEVAFKAKIAKDTIKGCHADVAGLILNRIPKEEHLSLVSELHQIVKDQGGCAFAGGIPTDQLLAAPRLNEVTSKLNAELLYGDHDDLDVDVSQMMIAAQGLPQLFGKLEYLVRALQ